MFLQNELVVLRPLKEEDVSGGYRNWLNDPEACAFNNWHRFPQSEESLIDFIRSSRAGSNRALVLAIETRESPRHVGNISLQSIDWISRQAEFAILIGDVEAHGKGIGHAAASLIIHHGFSSLNLHRIHCGTSSANTGMQRLALKLGFAQEGCRREALFKDGQFMDVIEYGLLANEWLDASET